MRTFGLFLFTLALFPFIAIIYLVALLFRDWKDSPRENSSYSPDRS